MPSARFEIGKKHRQAPESTSRASWNTPRNDGRSGVSYATRMAATFALTSLMTVLILVGVVVVVWSGVFSDYTRTNMVEIAQLTADRLATSYEQDGEWTTEYLASVAESNLVSSDIGLQVVDAEGTILYDDSWPAAPAAAGEGTSAQSGSTWQSSPAGSAPVSDIPRRAHGLVSTAPTDAEGAVTEPITLSDGRVVGNVRLWVLGSDALLTKADTAFREKTFNAMTLAAVIAVSISVIVGFVVSRMLTNPVRRITSTAKQIRDGDLSARTGMKGEDEIDRLGETFDEMATSLERDLRHERRITSDVAHELRTPLSVALMQCEELLAREDMPPEARQQVEVIRRKVDSMAGMVSQLLLLSRADQGREKLALEELDLSELSELVAQEFAELAGEKGIALAADIQPGVAITGDQTLLLRLWGNLLQNAVTYGKEGGHIWMKLSAGEGVATLQVRDDGVGIAPDQLPKIWERFYQVDPARSGESSGLGLSMVRWIVQAHGGTVQAESALGEGSTFTARLPLGGPEGK